MRVIFNRWTLKAADTTPVTVNPKRVDCVEFLQGPSPANEMHAARPACSLIRMQNKLQYMVEGTVEEVSNALNSEELRQV